MEPQELDFRIWDNKNKRLLYAGNEPIAIGISECSKRTQRKSIKSMVV